MTKTLYLIRHATAEEGGNSPMFKDFDRELTSVGIIETARMGKYMSEKGTQFDSIISSTAIRAISTAKIIAEQLEIDAETIIIDENIYGGGARAYLAATNGLDESLSSVAIVGHNPDISFYSEYLCRADIGGQMEKCGYIKIEFENQKWSEVSSKTGKFVEYQSPTTINPTQD
jgi:phosphohistidine phosphatase